MTREMARVEKILEIKPIDGADMIEACRVGGWWVVVKKGEYSVGDTIVYCEVDSWIPTDLAPFLSKGEGTKTYNGVAGNLLRSIKLRGQISQGLILPIEVLPNGEYNLGQNVSEILNIQKWEAPIPANLSGQIKGSFPTQIPKTEQERIQNLSIQELIGVYEVTEKLEGSSCTMFLIGDEFGVCSRNWLLEDTDDNVMWQMAHKYEVENSIKNMRGLMSLNNIAIQGEIVGQKVQGNIYKISGNDFYVYSVYDIDRGRYINPHNARELVNIMGLKYVPTISSLFHITKETNLEDILGMAEGESKLYATEREGLVFKSLLGTNESFKVISNKYLLGGK